MTTTLHVNNEVYGKRDIEINPKWSYGEVLEKIYEAYDIAEADRPKLVFLKQGAEIRNLTRAVPSKIPHCKTTLDEQFNYSKRIDTDKEVEVHFKKIPIVFESTFHSIYGHRTVKKILHIDPKKTLNEIRDVIREKFSIVDGAKINLVHQGKVCCDGQYDKTMEDYGDAFDPRHVIIIKVDPIKNRDVLFEDALEA